MKINILEQLGLTQKEAEIYKVLLSLGECPVIDVLNKTQDHPQIVYRALDGLEAKDLIISIYKKHKKYVRAEDPKILIEMEAKRMADLKEIIADLSALQKESDEALVRVYRGDEAIQDIRKKAIDIIAEGGVYYVLSGRGDRFYESMGNKLAPIERKRIRKKITKKMIMFESQRTAWQKNKYPGEEEHTRFLSEDSEVPATTCIFGNFVALQVWTKEPLVIEIESPEVAESYRLNFEMLWKMAKP